VAKDVLADVTVDGVVLADPATPGGAPAFSPGMAGSAPVRSMDGIVAEFAAGADVRVPRRGSDVVLLTLHIRMSKPALDGTCMSFIAYRQTALIQRDLMKPLMMVPRCCRSEADMKIGFVGLGAMGRGIARNLVRAGFPTAVFENNCLRSSTPERSGRVG
jgi:6-phosphogluconate dehydrogenase-like protein